MVSFTEARRNMVDCQLRPFDVSDRAVLAAMDEVPREAFLPAELAGQAYRDGNIVLPPRRRGAESRVLLAPMVLARLIQVLRIESGARVLDVAGGAGYSAAILSRLGAVVVALESGPDLAGGPELAGVQRRTGDLTQGCPQDGPFDAILINGAVETEPSTLLDQLVEGGRLACLRAGPGPARATIYVRSGGGVGSKALFDAAAPPLGAFRAAPGFTF